MARNPPGCRHPDNRPRLKQLPLTAMGIDQEGYGFPEHQRTIARLMDDVRILSPSGVERVAQGWDEHVGEHGLPEFRESPKAALHAIERADRAPASDDPPPTRPAIS